MSAEYQQDLEFIEATLHELANWTRDQIANSKEPQEATQKIDLIQVALMKLHMVRNRLEVSETPVRHSEPKSN